MAVDATHQRVHYRSVDELMRSQLAERTSSAGVVFVRHDERKIDMFAPISSNVDLSDEGALSEFTWLSVSRDNKGWFFDDLEAPMRAKFIAFVVNKAQQRGATSKTPAGTQ
jgi:hypothetical protein